MKILLVACLLLLSPAVALAEAPRGAEPSTPTDACGSLTSLDSDAPQQRGCCSWHGGVCGCSLGRTVCCDGALSPSCTCKGGGSEVGQIESAIIVAQDVPVKGYFRQDGTYVQPHMRSAPDSSYNNNWSTSPNVNPYTGQQGTNQPRLYNPNPPTGYGNSNPWGGGSTQPRSRSRW